VRRVRSTLVSFVGSVDEKCYVLVSTVFVSSGARIIYPFGFLADPAGYAPDETMLS